MSRPLCVPVDNAHSHCHFPSWVTDHHHWHTIDNAQRYSFHNSTIKIHVSRDATLGGGPGVQASDGRTRQPGRYHMEGGLRAGLRGDRTHDRDISGVCHSVNSYSDNASKMIKVVVRVVSGW